MLSAPPVNITSISQNPPPNINLQGISPDLPMTHLQTAQTSVYSKVLVLAKHNTKSLLLIEPCSGFDPACLFYWVCLACLLTVACLWQGLCPCLVDLSAFPYASIKLRLHPHPVLVWHVIVGVLGNRAFNESKEGKKTWFYQSMDFIHTVDVHKAKGKKLTQQIQAWQADTLVMVTVCSVLLNVEKKALIKLRKTV